jgi:hypothetical protein
MAILTLTDSFCYAGGYDFTTDINNAVMTTEAAQLDVTTFGSGGWNESVGGLKSVAFNYSGFWQVDGSGDQAVDNQAFPMLATSQPYTFGPVETEGQVAYIFNAMKTQYTLGGSVGEVMPFSLSATGTDGQGAVRARLAKAKGSVSAAGGTLGTGLNLGATSTQYIYAAFHVFEAGTDITVRLQSDDNSDFTTATTLATSPSLTASGGTWFTRIAGPITDSWYRFNVSSITGTFVVGGAIGRQ